MKTLWTPKFTKDDLELLETRSLLKSHLTVEQLNLRFRLFQGGWSHPVTRELLKRAHAAAVLLYHPPSDQVAMIEQCRLGMLYESGSPWILEPVAGLIDHGETAEETACRETIEEAGCHITHLIPVATYIVSPGISTELTMTYCGIIDTLPAQHSIHGLLKDGENIRLHCLPAEAAIALLSPDQPLSASSTILLQWFRWQHPILKSGAYLKRN